MHPLYQQADELSHTVVGAAEDVVAILERHGVDAVVIGATALAAYRYVRQTEDIDLGVNADLPTLRAVAASLRQAGFSAELLARNPELDLTVIRAACDRYRLPGLDELIADAY